MGYSGGARHKRVLQVLPLHIVLDEDIPYLLAGQGRVHGSCITSYS